MVLEQEGLHKQRVLSLPLSGIVNTISAFLIPDE